ncbi:MAG: hypothetical protein HZC01_04345 [Candidatus Kerfeldbacteria bacterium]|nr:hypothetical protein [Candidatus Kerfeldbacteria bacterium]
MARRGIMVVIDGIDGSGKGTFVQVLADWAKRKHYKIFDVVAYEKKNYTLPQPSELKGYQVLITAEPTHSLIGKAIREEIARSNERMYTARATAEAYALDRYILLQRVIIPALAAGKYIFQERSLTTSLAYQPIQAEPLSVKDIIGLAGNQLALKHRPDLLCILKTDVAAVMQRLRTRKKKDRAIFERKSFLEKAQRRFTASWFREMYQKRGAQVVTLDTTGGLIETKKKMQEVWEGYLKKAL